MPEPVFAQLPLGADAAAKAAHYASVAEALEAVLQDEPNFVAALALTASALHQAFAWHSWTGFYLVWGRPDELVVGPFQGGLGCRRIPFARGVCGAAASTRTTQTVADVHAFPGHIACASSTQSELVVPLLASSGGEGSELLGVLDIDSDAPAAFDATDAAQLERICSWLADKYLGWWQQHIAEGREG